MNNFILPEAMDYKKTLILVLLSLLFSADLFSQKVDTTKIKKDSIQTRVLNSLLFTGNSRENSINRFYYNIKEIKNIVNLTGEADPIKYIMTLPGISSGMEGGNGFFVRGGNNANNRTEIDNVPVYGNSHLFGLFSTFDPGIISSITFSKGKIGTNLGDFTSSICNIQTVLTDSIKKRNVFSISPLIAGLSITSPLSSKITFNITGRYSLISPEIKLLRNIFDFNEDVKPETSDLFFKLQYSGNRQKITFGTYFSNDYFQFLSDSNIELNWGNTIFYLNWDYKISKEFQLISTIYSSRYQSGQKLVSNIDEENIQSDQFSVKSDLNESAIKLLLKYDHKSIYINGGLSIQHKSINPYSEKLLIANENPILSDKNSSTLVYTAFADISFIIDRFNFTFGVRNNYFKNSGYTFYRPDIRISSGYTFSKNSGIELSIDQLSQFHHTLEGLPVSWPLDVIVPSDIKFKPEYSDQIYTGGYFSLHKLKISAGAFYKRMSNLVSYTTAQNLFRINNSDWYNDAASGKGVSYGVETRGEYRDERLDFNLSYTLSKTTREYKEINNGNSYPFKFDRRHVFNFNGGLITKKTSKNEQRITSTVSISSGHNMTIPVGMYKGVIPPYYVGDNYKELIYSYYRVLMSEKNGYSLPIYFRTDLGYSFIRRGEKITSELSVGISNITNRKNPYLIFYDEEKWKQLSIIPFMPVFRLEIKF